MAHWRAVVVAAAVALASCAAIAPPAQDGGAFVPLPDASFEIAGRLSARRGDDGVAASYRWRHQPAFDEFVFASPMGGSLARLSGVPGSVRLERTDGGVAEAGDWQTLASEVLGAPLPVDGLAWWVRASPRPGSAFRAEPDASGRLSVLRQDGWEIVYAYRGSDRRPARLTLAFADVELRLVVDTESGVP